MDRYLGPAEVLESSPLRIRREDGREVPARPGFTFPFTPAPGDVLLVVEGERDHWAIGVISGRAPESLSFPGDVTVRAVGGTLNLKGDRGVEVEAPLISLRGESLRTVVESISEKTDGAYRFVKDLLTVRAGESRRIVMGEDHSRSKRSVTLAEGTVKIDGGQVHLGH